MKIVQVALRDSGLAQSLRDLLVGDGGHQVHLLELPNVDVTGVIVLDMARFVSCGFLGSVPERLVVIASKAHSDLAQVWKSGVQHVVFYGDDPRTLQVAVLATELTLMAGD